uniref:Uncharacterized protein n=1 Tax=Panagrolaimus sp. JU765 TaxID=591449 RepID=A0AC34RLL9_9BILA
MEQKQDIQEGQQRLGKCLMELNCQEDELCPLEKLWETYEQLFNVKFDQQESQRYFGEPDVIMALQRFMCSQIDFALKLDLNHEVLRFIVLKKQPKHEKTQNPEADEPLPEDYDIINDYGRFPELEERVFRPPKNPAPKITRPPPYTVDDLSKDLASFTL